MSTPGTAAHDEIGESIAQAVAAFRSWFVNPRRGGETVDEPGLFIGCAGTLLPFGNGAVMTSSIKDVADLEGRIKIGSALFEKHGVSGLFFVCDALIPTSLRDAVPLSFAQFGYVPAMGMTGMAADHIVAPVRALPKLHYESVADVPHGEIMAWLNCVAYGVPLEWGPDWEARTGISQSAAFGFIGYANNEPVACAATIALLNCLYVGLVATHPDHRKHGYAEAVMRHSLQAAATDTGLSRTILHASDMGHPLYAQMGYHDTVQFTLYGRHPE